MNNNLNFQFGMYEPSTDSIIVNTGENTILAIRCKECKVNTNICILSIINLIFLRSLSISLYA